MNETMQSGPLVARLSDLFGISAEVAELLRERDMYAEPAFPGGDNLLLVRDEEGTALFQMTPRISAIDLRLMLAYAGKMHQAGVRAGQQEAQGRMRRALGLDA
jgi:hypothetical protein